MSECPSNVLITGGSNFDERNGQLIILKENNFLRNPYFSMVERRSEKLKRACPSIRDFKLCTTDNFRAVVQGKYQWTFYVQATCHRHQTYSELISKGKLPKKLRMQYAKENSANLTHIFCCGSISYY